MALYEYDAFGNIITKCGSLANSFLFSTQLSNSNAGWHMYMFRNYDPQLGRWTQRDPLGIDGPNLYHFCINNPLNYMDYHGTSVSIAIGATLLLVAGGLLLVGAISSNPEQQQAWTDTGNALIDGAMVLVDRLACFLKRVEGLPKQAADNWRDILDRLNHSDEFGRHFGGPNTPRWIKIPSALLLAGITGQLLGDGLDEVDIERFNDTFRRFRRMNLEFIWPIESPLLRLWR